MNARLRHALGQWQTRQIPRGARVALDQRRIFLLPTASGGTFALVQGLILLAAINYQNSLAYGLTFLLGSLTVVAIVHTYRNQAGLILGGSVGPAVFAGEQARFILRLDSGGRAHQAIGCGWTRRELQRIDIDVDGGHSVELALATARRGWQVVPRIRIETSFPLGVIRAWSWVDPSQKVLVYPQPLAGELPLRSGRETDDPEQIHTVLQPGTDDFQGLRVYQPGDSWRRLDWRAFSRNEALLIKDFADASGEDPCLDFAALGGDTEQRLSRLCFWVLALTQQGRPFSLQLPGQLIVTDSGAEHRDACLHALALHGMGPQ